MQPRRRYPPGVTDRQTTDSQDEPELRDAPPWLMEEMVDGEPALAEAIVRQPISPALTSAVRRAQDRGEPIVVVGCGTSEHAAMAVAALLDEARGPEHGRNSHALARQAFEAALDPIGGGVCIAVTHEGSTRATLDALLAARGAGATTAVITAGADSPAAAVAEHLIATPLVDRSWCHTVGYVSPILAGAVLAASLREDTLPPESSGKILEGVLSAARAQASRVAPAMASADRWLVVGSGVDRIAARELALKIEEGVRRPATGRDLETLLHGHLAACDERTGLVLLALDPSRADERLRRGMQAMAAARALGMPVLLVATRPVEHEPALRLPEPGSGVSPVLGALLTGAAALQVFTLALVHQVGVNPDRIGRERPSHRQAAELIDAAPPVTIGT